MNQQPWYDKPYIVLPGALLLWATYVSIRHADTIQYQNYGQIERGISQAQVETLLGVTPGDYSTGTVEYEFRSGSRIARRDLTSWRGNEGTIRVAFDTESKVVYKEWVRAQREYSFAWWCKILGWLEYAKALDLVR